MPDPITAALTAAQIETTAHLWTPDHPVVFTPKVLSTTFGDGRALFRITTINNRPYWWLVRGCSTWSESNDPENPAFLPVIDFIDDIVQAIADEFGGLPNMESETDTETYVDHATGRAFDPADIIYPQVDDRSGTFWVHEDWPDLPGVTLIAHPEPDAAARGVRVLAAQAELETLRIT